MTGARLFLPLDAPNKFAEDGRCTVDAPMSARLLPEEERWNTGWLGLPGASDMRDPETERA